MRRLIATEKEHHNPCRATSVSRSADARSLLDFRAYKSSIPPITTSNDINLTRECQQGGRLVVRCPLVSVALLVGIKALFKVVAFLPVSI